MATLSAPAFPLLPGEGPGDRIARIVKCYAGCVPCGPVASQVRRQDLAALVGRGVMDESFVAVETNCATFALGVLAAAGVKHPLLEGPTAIGRAFSDLVQIGDDLGAWKSPVAQVPPGGAMWYRLPEQNDDHVEFALDPPDQHGGGGRPDNAVTVGHGDEHWSWSRPLWRWLDPTALGIPIGAPAPSSDPHPVLVDVGA